MKSFHCAGLIIAGGSGALTDIEVFPARATCTIPPFPSPGKLLSCSSSHCNCCQREILPLPLCDQRHRCGVRWLEHLDQKIVHIVEERPGRLGGLLYFEVRLCAFITNTPDNNAFKMILWSSKQIYNIIIAQKTYFFSAKQPTQLSIITQRWSWTARRT